MSDKANKRSGMLGTIYNMLPGIDDDYAAKLVYTLEDKKTLPQLQQDIANIAAQLSSDSPMTDTIVAKILLDEITIPAALRQLRIYNNSTCAPRWKFRPKTPPNCWKSILLFLPANTLTKNLPPP